MTRSFPLVLAAAAAALLPLAAHADDDAEAQARRALRRTPIVKAVEKVSPSVVSIGTKQLVKQRFWNWEVRERIVPGALGSGVIVHPRGYVVTNLHVINRAHEIYVTLTGLGEGNRQVPARLVAVDPGHDLALLRLDADGPFPTVPYGRSDDLMMGETVIAVGNPFGLGKTVSTGVVSAMDRSITIREQQFQGLIQTDAAVNQGNSGGALLNILGEWIGVNSAIYSLSGGSDGISFAIPVETVHAFLARSLIPRRIADRWLGVEFEPIPGGGVKTSTVYPVGPANQKGIRPGRRVVSVNGEAMDDVLAVRMAVLDAMPGGSVTLELEGGEGRTKLTVPFERLPTDDLLWKHFGLTCVEITPDVADKQGYREGAGVMVSKVREGGPAKRIGLLAGDLIRAFGPRRVGSLEDLLLVALYTRTDSSFELALGRTRRTRGGGTSVDEYKGRIVAD